MVQEKREKETKIDRREISICIVCTKTLTKCGCSEEKLQG